MAANSVKPNTSTVTLRRGDSYEATWTVPQRSDGYPTDIIGAAVLAQLRDDPDSSTVRATLVATVTDALARTGVVRLTAAQTAALNDGGVIDVHVTLTDGQVVTAQVITAAYAPDVSRT